MPVVYLHDLHKYTKPLIREGYLFDHTLHAIVSCFEMVQQNGHVENL